jgi:hypothetical protein
MGESDVRGKVGEEQGRLLPDVPPAPEQDGVRDASGPAKREADEEWLELAAEDPAFFIKYSDTV